MKVSDTHGLCRLPFSFLLLPQAIQWFLNSSVQPYRGCTLMLPAILHTSVFHLPVGPLVISSSPACLLHLSV